MLLFKWIRSFQLPQDQLSLRLNGVCFIRLQVAFVFPAHPPFFLKDSDFLIKCRFIHVKSLHSFPSIFLPGGSQEDVLLVRHSSFFSSPVELIQALIDHILFLFQIPSHTGAPHNNSLLAIHLFRSAQDISEDSCFHSAFIQTLSRMLSLSRHLIQPVQHLF